MFVQCSKMKSQMERQHQNSGEIEYNEMLKMENQKIKGTIKKAREEYKKIYKKRTKIMIRKPKR